MGGEREEWLRQATRYRILIAAETCFAARGFDGARVEDVAGVAGVSKSHLYYHFASKQELLSCLVELRTAEMLAEKDELFAGADLGALVADTAELELVLARAVTEVLVPRRAFIRIVLVEAIRNPSAAAPVFAALDTVLEDSLARFSRAGLVADIATTKSLLFYFGLLPALFRVAVEEDPTGLPGGPAALAGSLARIEQALVCARRDPL